MKTSIHCLAIILLLGFTLTRCNKEDEIVKIPAGEIPDMLFRDYLLVNFDTNMDGFISEREAKNVKEIDLSEKGVKSLKGIEYFTSLEKLNIRSAYNSTEIIELDLSKNIMLEVLDCSQNFHLQTLVLPDSKRLKSLNCSNTRIESINLSGFNYLEDFTFHNEPYLGGHSIGMLEISNSSAKKIYCHGIKDLILGNLPDLEFISVRDPYYQFGNHAVDLTKSTKLKSLTLVGINWEINISQCPALEELICESSKAVDLSKHTALKYLDISVSQDIDLDISNCLALETLYFTGNNSKLSSFKNNPALKTVSIKYIKEGEMLDFSANTLLEKLHVQANCHVSNLSNCKNLVEFNITSNNTINKVDAHQLNALKKVTLLGCRNLTSVNLSGCHYLDSLSIIFVMEELDIDISGCRNLSSLTLEDLKNFNKLDASGCTFLKKFEYQPNEYNPSIWSLTSLNMSDCTSLLSLSCKHNKLTSLNVSGCVALKTFSCYANKLKELDVHTCLALQELNCCDNSDLKTLTLNSNHQIINLYKDPHTQIVLKE